MQRTILLVCFVALYACSAKGVCVVGEDENKRCELDVTEDVCSNRSGAFSTGEGIEFTQLCIRLGFPECTETQCLSN